MSRPGARPGCGGLGGRWRPSVIWKSAALSPAAVPSRKRSLINAKSPRDYRTRKSNDFIVIKVYCRRGATGRRIICHLLERAAGIVRRCRAGGTEPPQGRDRQAPVPSAPLSPALGRWHPGDTEGGDAVWGGNVPMGCGDTGWPRHAAEPALSPVAPWSTSPAMGTPFGEGCFRIMTPQNHPQGLGAGAGVGFAVAQRGGGHREGRTPPRPRSLKPFSSRFDRHGRGQRGRRRHPWPGLPKR